MTIIVDTREQLPLWETTRVVRRGLLVGDYTTEKLINKFHIERKSLQDLYGSIIQNHVRFRKMFVRAKVNNITIAVYIEGTREDFMCKKFPGGSARRCSGDTLCKIIDTMAARHGFRLVWCKNRTSMTRRIVAELRRQETSLQIRKQPTRKPLRSK